MKNLRTDERTPADRIARLEDRLRVQARFNCGLLVLGLCLFLLGAAPGMFEEIKARRFVVSDENENPRALLTSHRGATVLSMFDSDGIARLRFSVMEDGHPEITLQSSSGRTLIRLAEHDGSALLQLQDGREDSAAGQIVVGQVGEQFGLNVSSGGSEAGVRLRAHPEQPQVAVIGEAGGVVQVFSHSSKSGISISDGSGQPGAILTVLDNLRPMLLLQGKQKRTLVVPQENVLTSP